MKPFSLERAIAGDPILVRSYPTSEHPWISGIHFVGVDKDGLLVLQWPEGDLHKIYDPERLAMAPRKTTVYLNILEGGPAAWFIHESVAQEIGHNCRVIARAVPIEIEE